LFLQTANWADEVDEEEKQEAQQKAAAEAAAPATEEDGEFFLTEFLSRIADHNS
jgi:hypothetical protein